MADNGREGGPPPIPRWVVWGAIALGVLLLLGLVAVVSGVGGHGPGRHESLMAAA